MGRAERLEPALRGQDVVAPVGVEIACADPVSVALRTDDVLHPFPILQLVPEQRRAGRARELGEQFERLAVVVQVHEEGKLGGADGVDLRFRPGILRLAGVLQPDDAPGEVGNLHDVGEAVPVHVHRQVAEVVHVPRGEADVANLVCGP